jgi:two-component system, chemotaxis family, CheB/CheR fusion protein
LAVANSKDELENLLDYLKTTRGFDFSGYKRTTLGRRIERRMQVRGLSTYDEYQDYLELHADEFQELFNAVLLNVTSFFRDSAAWEFLETETIPRLLKEKAPDEPIRAWVAGCASGEEAFTLAMVLARSMEAEAFKKRVKIYATDLDDDALSQSRTAAYSLKEVENVPPELLAKHFIQNQGKYTFDGDLRRAVVFGRHDLIHDAPISRIDLLSCRNTLMYFNAETQDRILARFHFALNDGGFLMLGSAETLLTRGNLFIPVSSKHHVFSKVGGGRLRDRAFMLAPSRGNGVHIDGQARLREAAFESSPVAQIVLDQTGQLAAVNESAKIKFGLASKDIGRLLQDLSISFQPLEIRTGLLKAYDTKHPVIYKEVRHTGPTGNGFVFEVTITPLFGSPLEVLGAVVAFEDVTQTKRLQEDLVNFNQELETAYEEVQSTNEELQTTNEELQSTIEELETTNEELHSTNEELETMNEELQSANEELETINQELHQRTEALNESNAFLQSILGGLRDCVIVVNREMQILAWNSKSEDLWGLRMAEVQGKHLLNLDIGLSVQQMRDPVRTCLGGESTEEMRLECTNRRGKAVQCEVRCAPLMGLDVKPRGVIIIVREL